MFIIEISQYFFSFIAIVVVPEYRNIFFYKIAGETGSKEISLNFMNCKTIYFMN